MGHQTLLAVVLQCFALSLLGACDQGTSNSGAAQTANIKAPHVTSEDKQASLSGFITLYTFSNDVNGAAPESLFQASDGNFYGGTGGTVHNTTNTLFSVTPTGTLKTIASFGAVSFGGTSLGQHPFIFLQAANSALYGGTLFGDSNRCQGFGCGSIFESTTNGDVTTLASFSGTDGQIPSGLIEGPDGNFYRGVPDGDRQQRARHLCCVARMQAACGGEHPAVRRAQSMQGAETNDG